MEEHKQAAERLQARLSGQQSAGAELQEELGEQQQLLQRAQEARRAAAEVSTRSSNACSLACLYLPAGGCKWQAGAYLPQAAKHCMG